MKVLILEDELRAAQRLSELITEVDDTIHVVGIIDSVEQALNWFGEHEAPDLLFSDIQLADGLCFDLFNNEKIKINCPVIFCTAYEEYLIHAFETNAVSYLLKPINKEQIQKTLEKYQTMKQVFNQKNQPDFITGLLDEFQHIQKYKSILIINQGEKMIPLRTLDIAFVQLDTYSVVIHTTTHQKYHYPSSLEFLESQLNPDQFFRANRQFIINRNAVTTVERSFNRKLVIKLVQPTPEKICVSKMKAAEFLEWLKYSHS